MSASYAMRVWVAFTPRIASLRTRWLLKLRLASASMNSRAGVETGQTRSIHVDRLRSSRAHKVVAGNIFNTPGSTPYPLTYKVGRRHALIERYGLNRCVLS